MIRQKEQPSPEKQIAEPKTGRPARTGEEWLGRNRSSKRRLWERLNPRSRKQIHMIAQALALQQMHAQLPEPLRARLSAAVEELEQHLARIRALLAEVARRTPRGE
jgi:type II secretory pathway component PulM